MTHENAAGERFLCCDQTLKLAEIGAALVAALPDLKRKVPTFELPSGLVRLVSHFDRNLKSIRGDLDKPNLCDTSKVREQLGVTFRPSREAVAAAAVSLRELGVTKLGGQAHWSSIYGKDAPLVLATDRHDARFGGILRRLNDRQSGQGKGAKMMSMLRCVLGRFGCLKGALVAILVMLGHGTLPATAQRQPPPSKAAMQYSFAPIVRKATPAVVNVYVKSTARVVRSPLFADPFFREFFRRQFAPRRRRQNSLGSGVIVNESGLIVTNTHVVKSSGEAEVRVVLADRREFKADIVQQDEKTDIALIKIRGAGAKFPFIRFAEFRCGGGR